MKLNDSTGETLSEDEQELFANEDFTNVSDNQPDSDLDAMPFVAHTICRTFDAHRASNLYGRGNPPGIAGFLKGKAKNPASYQGETINAFVTPYTFVVKQSIDGSGRPFGRMYYSERRRMEVRIPVPLDKMKQAQDITCKVVYVPAAAAKQ